MQQRKNWIAAFLIVIHLVGLSCKARKRYDHGEPDGRNLFPDDFIELRTHFKMDSIGRIDTTRGIPLSLIRHFMEKDLDTSCYGSGSPLLMDEEPLGYIFVFKMNCTASAKGVRYYTINFDKKGAFLGRDQLKKQTR